MTAASPASPPPTTMTFGAADILLSSFLFLVHRRSRRSRFGAQLVGTLVGGLPRCGEEAADAEHAHAADGQEDEHADDEEAAARFVAHGDTPLGAEQPYAIREMPGGG